jgi:hypothetical protein
VTEETSKSSRRSIRIGWFFTLVGVFVFLFFLDWFSWQWWFIIAAFLFYLSGLQRNGNLEMLFPGTILLILGSVLLLRKYDLMVLPLWQYWSILFGSMGFAFILMWLIRSNRSWVFIPGGILLITAGGGFGAKSFFSYQRWLREIANHWYLLLTIIIIATAVIYWRRHSEQKSTL